MMDSHRHERIFYDDYDEEVNEDNIDAGMSDLEEEA
jgi:hypothetical protein